MKHKHKFNEVLELVLEERKNSYKSLRTAAWEKKIAKRIFEYLKIFSLKISTMSDLTDFFLLYVLKTIVVFIATNTLKLFIRL